MEKIFSMMMIFSIIIIFHPITANAEQVLINEKYELWIDFPLNWSYSNDIIRIEPTPGKDLGGYILATISDGVYWWDVFVTISVIENNLDVNIQEKEFLDKMILELDTICNFSTVEFAGFDCIEHKILEKNILKINGHKTYQIKDAWTEKYPDGTNSSKIGIVTQIIVENDIWQIETLSVSQKYEEFSKQLNKITHSFRLGEEPISNYNIPEWVKNNAGWWAEDSINDETFVQGMQFLIKEGIIQIPLDSQVGKAESEIPKWVKNNAGWWAEDSINDETFVQGMQFLIKEGIIKN